VTFRGGDGSVPAGAVPPSLTVVVPVYNAGSSLAVQLAALADQCYDGPWECLVVDNGSTDGSADVARDFAGRLPGLRVVSATDGQGPAFARNRGASLSEADALIFVDQDDQVAPGYLRAMGAALAGHDFVAARIDHDTLNAGWLAKARYHWQADGLMGGDYLPATSGCAMGIRRSMFEEIGGFDERFLYAQDIDLSWRADRAGAHLTFVPDAVLRYRYRARVRDHLRQEYCWGTDDALIYRTHRGAGMPAHTLRRAASQWRQIGRSARAARSLGDGVQVGAKAARCFGHLGGSVRHRVWFP
jgi:GT2 family glycosyltransferase